MTAVPLILMVPRPEHLANVAPSPPSRLEAHSADNSLTPLTYGMGAPNIFYPPAFAGSRKVVSCTVDIDALCGFELFTGGWAAYSNAVKTEIAERNDLMYRAQFVASTSGGKYNAREIAKVSMDGVLIINTPLVVPNRYLYRYCSCQHPHHCAEGGAGGSHMGKICAASS